ncbi:hypothetical protein SMD44_03002 [Streptomyces alboflavus]|uniref:Uncharacterized protein n=1 Tax=Streptomyces alboflavus TaxID=67267 RepID=A0A1Z1WB13_9ACTN|nr:hypothetical protein [Streptomyces alboflavus]ARX83580.1 hypothetical protein SMD44_03002 [Streptomyces alboflavus]
MGIFSKRPATNPAAQEHQIQQAKREAAQRHTEILQRLENGTATREDKRIFNAGRTRSGRI